MQTVVQSSLFESNWSNNLSFPKEWDNIRDGFPAFIHTERLSVRPLLLSSSSDVEWVEQNILRDKRVADGYLLVENANPEQVISHWFKCRENSKDRHFTISDSITGEIVGILDINILDLARGRAGIGYAFSYQHWGKGYATEVGDSAVSLLFETGKVETIEATVKENNPKSAHVLEKIGFIKKERMTYIEPVTNFFRTMPIYKLTRELYIPIYQAGGSWE